MENLIRAIKKECLDKIVFTSETQLRLAIKEYLEYWNHYRPHDGLDDKLVTPYPHDMTAPIKEVSFLGGLLHGYRSEPGHGGAGLLISRPASRIPERTDGCVSKMNLCTPVTPARDWPASDSRFSRS